MFLAGSVFISDMAVLGTDAVEEGIIDCVAAAGSIEDVECSKKLSGNIYLMGKKDHVPSLLGL